MLTIRDDALSLVFLKTKPNSDELMYAILDKESFDIWDNTPERKGVRLVNDAVKDATGATLAEILGLVDLVEEYESALTYDCLVIGLKLRLLGTPEFTWGELLAIVQNSPRFSAFYRAQHPDEWMWTEQEHLLAAIADSLAIANWQRGNGKRSDYPRPIKRPGVTNDDVTKFGKGAIPYDEMNDWLGGQFTDLNNKT